jgi:YVTN family beta-propeller protein
MRRHVQIKTMTRKTLSLLFCVLSLLALVFFLSLTVVAQERERVADDPEDEEDLNRELWEFARNTPYEKILEYVEEEQRKSRNAVKAEVELPNGWRLAPAGTQIPVGHLPYEALMFAGKLVVLNTGYYYREPQVVSVINLESLQVEKTLTLNSLFPSAQVGLDGNLYISGGFDEKVFRLDRDFKVHEYKVGGYAGGLAALDSDHIAVGYVATKNKAGAYVAGKLAVLNTSTGKIEREVRVGYFPYSVKALGGNLYVTLLGEDKLLVYSSDLKLLKSLGTGGKPQETCFDGRRLFVVNSDSDNLTIVDTRLNRVTGKVSLAATGSRFGTAPSSCAIDENRLYVTLANTNAMAVLDSRTFKRLALVPTGWYPTKALSNENNIFVVSAKGIQARRPNPKGPQPTGATRIPGYVLNLLQGTVSVIPKRDITKNAAAWTEDVRAGTPLFDLQSGFKLPIKHIFYIIKENRTYDQVLGDLGRGNGDPSLTLFGESISPVHHQLAKDYVTLDNFFVNGEISVLGHSFTTSGYASPFTEWLANNSYATRWKGYPFGTVPAVTSPAYLWDLLDERKVDYRIYGENYFLFTRAYKLIVDNYGVDSELARKFYDKSMASAAGGDRGNEFFELAVPFYGQAQTPKDALKLLDNQTFTNKLSEFLVGDESLAQEIKKPRAFRFKAGLADYLYHYPFNYRSWDLKHSDLDRYKSWKIDFDSQLKSGQVAQLHYIWLPNDHTDGANSKNMDPFQFMAQNDAALGRIVQTISHSPIWKQSLILIEEDDAQNGPDHVDATRTVAFAIGPYVKRGTIVSDRYDQLSMLRTIELLLGLRSLNLSEQVAVPMWGVFTSKPNFEPFVRPPVSSRLSDVDRARDKALD